MRDVLVERARRRARLEDALDRGVLVGAKLSRMAEREIDVFRAVALSQQQDLTRLCGPDPWPAETHRSKEVGGRFAHTHVRLMELLEVECRLPAWWRMQTCWVEREPGATRRELMARNAAQVGCVHE